MSKFKLSETLRFLSARLQAITGGDVELEIDLQTQSIDAGRDLSAEARIRSPLKARQLDYLLIATEGQVQEDGKWRDFVQSAETAHDTRLPADHELIVPVRIRIPQQAVLSEDGGIWRLRVRAVLDRSLDRDQSVTFRVESSG